MTGTELILLVPEMIVAAVAAAILLVSVVSKRDNRWLTLMLAIAGALAAAAFSLQHLDIEPTPIFSGQFTIDRFTVFLRLLFLLVSVATLVLAVDQLKRIPFAEFAATVLFSTVGMMLLAGATDLIMIFIAVELMAIPVYVLTGFTRFRRISTEAAIKYFTLGAFATAVLAYGMAWTYGLTGQTGLKAISEALPAVVDAPDIEVLFALGLVLVGMAFKVAVVPFHVWSPDAYDGAPTPVSAFMSVGPKIAAMAMLVRMVGIAFEPVSANIQALLYVLAAASIIGGNIWAVQQTNIKRMLAYSSIAHSGYMLAGIAAATVVGDADRPFYTLLYYGVAYALMNVGAFAVVFAVERRTDSVEIGAFRGLAQTSWMPAAMMTIFMLSLLGMPPLAGFFGKLFIIQALVGADLGWLAVILVIGSVVSAYYYLRVVGYMFMRNPDEGADATPFRISDSMASVIFAAGIGSLAIGIFSNWLFEIARDSVLLASF